MMTPSLRRNGDTGGPGEREVVVILHRYTETCSGEIVIALYISVNILLDTRYVRRDATTGRDVNVGIGHKE